VPWRQFDHGVVPIYGDNLSILDNADCFVLLSDDSELTLRYEVRIACFARSDTVLKAKRERRFVSVDVPA
jgi:hypothetical protein